MTHGSTSLWGLAALTAFVGAACGSSGAADERPAKPGVSALSYSPQPFHKDMTVMTIQFTTTAPAGPGRRYMVELRSRGRDDRCIRDHAPYPEISIQGETGRIYSVTLDSETFFDDARFCEGPAELRVWTEKDVTPREGVQMLRKLKFRILPAR